VNFAAIEKGDRWTKKEMSEATEGDPELLLFASWVKNRILPVDNNKLAPHDPITKSLHVQGEIFKLKKDVLYKKYWENNKEAEYWQLVPPVKYCEEIMNTANASVTGGQIKWA